MNLSEYVKQLKSQPGTALVGSKWTHEEEVGLMNALEMGMYIDDIAKEHKRTPGGIHSRMKMMAVRMMEKDGLSMEDACQKMHVSLHDINDTIHRRDAKEKKDAEKTVSKMTDSIDKIAKDHAHMINIFKLRSQELAVRMIKNCDYSIEDTCKTMHMTQDEVRTAIRCHDEKMGRVSPNDGSES